MYICRTLIGMFEASPPLLGTVTILLLRRMARSEGTPGQLFTESCRMRGQRALIIKMPNGAFPGCVNLESASHGHAAVKNLLVHEGVIYGIYKESPPKAHLGIEDITAPHSGLWIPSIQSGDTLHAGQTIGDIDGEPAIAPCDALAHFVSPACYIRAGEDVTSYLRPNPSSC